MFIVQHMAGRKARQQSENRRNDNSAHVGDCSSSLGEGRGLGGGGSIDSIPEAKQNRSPDYTDVGAVDVLLQPRG